ncbi:MAG TPA: hypothetical protein PLF81_19800 [Candidatus Anammoximicrobium sp.]|nr:hypothetical protein [Candidatus Anammoximicrobium sp.]
MKHILRTRANHGRGVILAAVLLSLLVVMMLGAELTEAIVQHHRQSRLAEDRQQALWIAESALQRAAHALAKSPDYQGETWRVPAEVLGSGRAGVAAIAVKPAAGSATQRRIAVQAYYPDDPVQRTLYEREMILN